MLIKTIIRDMAFYSFKLSENHKKLGFKRVIYAFLSPEFRLVMSYRIYSCLYNTRFRFLSILLYIRAKKKYASDIHPACSIGVPFKIGHHMGIVIGPKAIIGSGTYIMNSVTIGNRYVGTADSMPVIGDNVLIGVGARVLGQIVIGNHAKIGANSLVITDVGSNESWGGVPARMISKCKHLSI